MSFGCFVRIYEVCFAVSFVVTTVISCVYLSRKYPVIWVCIVRDVNKSEEYSKSLVGAILSGACCALLWPIMIPRNAILLVRECNKKYRELYL